MFNNKGGAGVRRVFMPFTGKADIKNVYIIGSGVGAKTSFVRNALKKRANNMANGEQCKLCGN